MIFAIGHDIVQNDRIKRLYDLYGEQFIKRILSDDEQNILKNHNAKSYFIAKRFAAKEAFAKACGIGFRAPILMPDITVINDEMGKPVFNFNYAITKWLKERNILNCHVSLSDELNMSSAVVILEK